MLLFEHMHAYISTYISYAKNKSILPYLVCPYQQFQQHYPLISYWSLVLTHLLVLVYEPEWVFVNNKQTTIIIIVYKRTYTQISCLQWLGVSCNKPAYTSEDECYNDTCSY